MKRLARRLQREQGYFTTGCPVILRAPSQRFFLLVVALKLCSSAHAARISVDDVYLRLGDPNQEALTNSINLAITREPIAKKNSRTRFQETSKSQSVRIHLDAGHGGKDLGAPGYFSLLEKNVTLKICRMVKRELERTRSTTGYPLEILVSRDEDTFVGLKERVNLANKWDADLFVSIHANSSPVQRANGFEVYFLNAEGTDEETRRLALKENAEALAPVRADVMSILTDVQTTFHIEESAQFAETMFSAISRRVLSSGRGVRQGPFTVLTGTAMPAVLIEVGYVTNPLEAKNLTKDSYLKRLANAISTGIVEFATKQKKLG